MNRHRKNFSEMVDAAVNVPGNEGLRPVIEKELLHYEIISALDKGGFLSDLVFQGGTCLRLCYGARRLSEDLDFVGGPDFDAAVVLGMGECVRDHITEKYGLTADIKEPKLNREDPAYAGLNVDRWQISIVTSPEQRHLPKQRIKLEVINIPAMTSELMALRRNYDQVSWGVQNTLIRCESLREIMADKIVSFVNCREYTRYRDVWDLMWLKNRGASPDIEMISAKIGHYDADNYEENLVTRLREVDGIIAGSDFRDTMRRFLSAEDSGKYLGNPAFTSHLAGTINALLTETLEGLERGPESSPSDLFADL